MTIEQYSAYLMILLIATITPGPSMLLAINHGVNYGIGRTINTALGNLFGNLLMALISIAGLGAILVASGFLFNIIKWGGIIYLIFIGLKMIIEPVRIDKTDSNSISENNKKRYRLFIDGFIIAVGNPKGILFFTALFPQFINISNASISGFLIIFITMGVVAFGCFMVYALFGLRLTKLFKLQIFRKAFNRSVGTLLVGTGLAIAFSKK
jgi:homoserine/homoserine lactone efflux protein